MKKYDQTKMAKLEKKIDQLARQLMAQKIKYFSGSKKSNVKQIKKTDCLTVLD